MLNIIVVSNCNSNYSVVKYKKFFQLVVVRCSTKKPKIRGVLETQLILLYYVVDFLNPNRISLRNIFRDRHAHRRRIKTEEKAKAAVWGTYSS